MSTLAKFNRTNSLHSIEASLKNNNSSTRNGRHSIFLDYSCKNDQYISYLKLYPHPHNVLPGTVHQIWMQGESHLRINRPHFYESFQHYHQLNRHKHLLWTEEQIISLIVYEYPHLLELYHSYPHFIMRVDLAKYIILDFYGGFYVDMDSECLRSFHELTKFTSNNKALVCKVVNDYRTKLYSRKFINNHFLYIPCKHHRLTKIMLQEAPKCAKRKAFEPMILYILRAVGPGFLMHCIDKLKREEQKKWKKMKEHKHQRVHTEDVVSVVNSRIFDAYFVHESKNTWLEDKWMDTKDKNDIALLLTSTFLVCGANLAIFAVLYNRHQQNKIHKAKMNDY